MEVYISTFFLLIFSVLTILQVIMRYIFQNSLSWSEELARYAFVWFVYISASYAVKRQSHVKLSFLVELLPRKLNILVKYLALLSWIFFLLIIAYYSYRVTAHLILTMQLSPANQIPMYVFYIAIPAGILLMLFRVLQHIVKSTKEMRRVLKG